MRVSDDVQGHAEASRLHAEDGAPAPAALFSPVSLHQPTRCPALDPRLSRVCPTCGRAPPPGSSQGVGGLAIFLEPYDPQHMPIEFGFRAFKQFLRNQSELIDHMGMLHARVEQKRLKCNIFKTLFRSARLGRVEGSASARSAETTTTSDVAGT